MDKVKFLKLATVATLAAVGMAASLAATPPAAAAEPTAKDAEALVKKGVAHIKAGPRDKALAEITAKKDTWVQGELYLTVYKSDGTAVAHGTSPKMVGKNMLELTDADGKQHIRERLEIAKTKASFWQDYRTLNRESKKIEPKTAYCERADDLVVCGGIYKN